MANLHVMIDVVDSYYGYINVYLGFVMFLFNFKSLSNFKSLNRVSVRFSSDSKEVKASDVKADTVDVSVNSDIKVEPSINVEKPAVNTASKLAMSDKIENVTVSNVNAIKGPEIINPTQNRLSSTSLKFDNPLGSLRIAYKALGDIQSRNASSNFSMFARALRVTFANPNPRKLNFWEENVFKISVYQLKEVYGLLKALKLSGVSKTNTRIINFFANYFRSFKIDDVSLSDSLHIRDFTVIFNKALNNLKLWSANSNIVVVYVYNLVFNMIDNLMKGYDGSTMDVKIISRRFTRDSNFPCGISYYVTKSDGTEYKTTKNFISMPKHDIKLRNIMRHIPLPHKTYQSIMSSLKLFNTNVNAVRYDIETGSALLNVPNNPSVQNTAIVSRSVDSRGSENFAMTVTGIWCHILLLLFSKYYKIILRDERLVSYFTHYLITYFTDYRPENIFNTNFEINFSFKFDKNKLRMDDALPLTVANEFDLKTSVVNINDGLTVCESLLFMFDLEDDSWNNLFACASYEDHALYDTYIIDPLTFSIDPMGHDKSNICVPSKDDLVIMLYIRRYLGRFFPSILNSLTCASEFMSTDKGASTYELYTTNISWIEWLKSLTVDYLNDDIYVLQDIISADNFPVLFYVVRYVENTFEPVKKDTKSTGGKKKISMKIDNPLKSRVKTSNVDEMYRERVRPAEPLLPKSPITDEQREAYIRELEEAAINKENMSSTSKGGFVSDKLGTSSVSANLDRTALPVNNSSTESTRDESYTRRLLNKDNDSKTKQEIASDGAKSQKWVEADRKIVETTIAKRIKEVRRRGKMIDNKIDFTAKYLGDANLKVIENTTAINSRSRDSLMRIMKSFDNSKTGKNLSTLLMKIYEKARIMNRKISSMEYIAMVDLIIKENEFTLPDRDIARLVDTMRTESGSRVFLTNVTARCEDILFDPFISRSWHEKMKLLINNKSLKINHEEILANLRNFGTDSGLSYLTVPMNKMLPFYIKSNQNNTKGETMSDWGNMVKRLYGVGLSKNDDNFWDLQKGKITSTLYSEIVFLERFMRPQTPSIIVENYDVLSNETMSKLYFPFTSTAETYVEKEVDSKIFDSILKMPLPYKYVVYSPTFTSFMWLLKENSQISGNKSKIITNLTITEMVGCCSTFAGRWMWTIIANSILVLLNDRDPNNTLFNSIVTYRPYYEKKTSPNDHITSFLIPVGLLDFDVVKDRKHGDFYLGIDRSGVNAHDIIKIIEKYSYVKIDINDNIFSYCCGNVFIHAEIAGVTGKDGMLADLLSMIDLTGVNIARTIKSNDWLTAIWLLFEDKSNKIHMDYGWVFICTNDARTKEKLMDELIVWLHAWAVTKGYEYIFAYNNLVWRPESCRYTRNVGNFPVQEVDIANYKRIYTIIKDSKVDKATHVGKEDYNVYHKLANKVSFDTIDPWLKYGRSLESFHTDQDFKPKSTIFNEVFGTSYNTYQQMIDHKFKDFTSAANVSRSAIANEPGRTLGFLHELDTGKQRLRDQVDAMINVKPVLPIRQRSEKLMSSIQTPTAEMNVNKLFAEALSTMPLNSSSAVSGYTAAQWLGQYSPSQLIEQIDTVDRSWKTTIRLDQGGKYRWAFNRHILIRFVEYCILRHVYKWLSLQRNTSLTKTTIELSAYYDRWYETKGNIVCIDYDKFDAHISSIDVFDIKQSFARATPFTIPHLDKERFDYPLVDAKTKTQLVERCNKLCSGEYITSFIGTFFQMATYDMMGKSTKISDYQCGGDDAALLFESLSPRDLLAALKNKNAERYNLLHNKNISQSDKYAKWVEWYFNDYTGDQIAFSKCYVDVVAYNRRIWYYKTYPYNNMFTLVNTIYREEKREINSSIKDMSKRKYDVYLAYVALMIRLMDFGLPMSGLKMIEDDLRMYAQIDPNKLMFREVINISQLTYLADSPLVDSLKYDLEVSTISPIYNELYGDMMVNMIKRYISNPHLDFVQPKIIQENVNCIIECERYALSRLYMKYGDVPFWMQESMRKFRDEGELPRQYTLFADLASKLNIQIKAVPLKVQFSDTKSLAKAMFEYLATIFPNNLRGDDWKKLF